MSDRSECPGYDEYIDECLRACRCCRCCRLLCDGVLAGGVCDEMECVLHEGDTEEGEDE